MSTDDDHTTDKHDESNTAQFGDDPHNLRNTPFEEGSCVDCGAYVVKTRGYTGECRCIECGRTAAGIEHNSGANVGAWHPTTPSATPTQPTTPRPVLTIQHGTWQWGCLWCRETGTALNEQHATAMHKIHIGYACPAAPGLSYIDVAQRLQRRQALTHLNPDTTPPMYLHRNNDGTWKAVFTKPGKGK